MARTKDLGANNFYDGQLAGVVNERCGASPEFLIVGKLVALFRFFVSALRENTYYKPIMRPVFVFHEVC